MNDGVKILLARMETHPEEFAIRMNYGESQWGALINMFKHCLDKEDMDALEAGTRKCNQEVFTQKVMQALLDPQETNTNLYTVQSTIPLTGGTGTTLGSWGAATSVGNVTLNANSMTLGNTTIDEEQLKHMKAHIETLKKQEDSLIKKHPTKFGKLYTS